MDEVKKLLSSILISSKEGVPTDRIEAEYYDLCVKQLPYRALGFATASALLEAMPDVAYTRRDSQGVLRYYAKGDETTQHILRLVRNQKSNRKAPKRPTSSGMNSRLTPGKRNNASLPVYSRKPPIASNGPYSSFPLPPLPGSTTLRAGSGGERKVVQTAVEKVTEGLRRLASTPTPTSADAVHRTPALQANFGQIPNTNPPRPAPVLRSFDVRVATSDTGRAINIGATRPHFSPAQASLAVSRNDNSSDSYGIPGSADIHRTSAKGESLRHVSASSPAAASAQVLTPNRKAVLAKPNADHEVLRRQLQQFLATKPRGVRMAALAKLLKEYTHQDPPENLQALVRQWSDIITVEEINLEGSNAIVYGKHVTSVHGDAGGKCDNASSYTTAVVKPHLSFTTGDYTECRITHIKSINEFYIHLQGSSALTSLMEKMQEYYNRDEETPILPVNDSCVDCFCAVKNTDCDVWSRGRIVNVGLETADVLYIDFGGLTTVPLSQIRPLARAFVQPEEQAIRCCLAGFGQSDLPADKVQQVTEKFRHIAQHEWLTAVITRVLKAPRRLEVDIYVTRGLVFVNECLDREEKAVTSPPSPAANILPALQLPTEAFWDVTVTFIESHKTVILQILGAQHSDRLESLTEEARKFYTSSEGKQKRATSVTAGNIYMVKVEDSWFRMRVLPSSLLKESGMLVLCTFVDYGDVAIVTWNHIYELDTQFTNLPGQALMCTLDDFDDSPPSDVVVERMVDMLSTLAMGKALIAVVNTDNDAPKGDGGLPVILIDTNGDVDININNKLSEVAFTVEQSDFKDFRRVSSSSSLRLEVKSTGDELKGIGVSNASPYHSNDNLPMRGTSVDTTGPVAVSTGESISGNSGAGDISSIFQDGLNASASANRSDIEDPMDIPLSRSPLSAGNLLYVYITHVSSPDYFAAVPQNDLADLSELTKEMYTTYTSSTACVFRTDPLVGGWYSAFMEDRYYRVKVLQVNPESAKVKVYVVDFGDTREINISALTALAKKFKFLPPLALKMRLAGVKPRSKSAGSCWSSEICQRFSELTIDKMLFAIGVSVLKDTVDGSVISEVKLVETSGDADVDIQMVLGVE